MYTNNPLGPNYNEGMVDRLLGKAYLTIKDVHDNLTALTELNSNTATLFEDNSTVKKAVEELTKALQDFEASSGFTPGHDLGTVGDEDPTTYTGDANYITALAKSADYLETLGKNVSDINSLAIHINEIKAIASALKAVLTINTALKDISTSAEHITDIQVFVNGLPILKNVDSHAEEIQALSQAIDAFPELFGSAENINITAKNIASVNTCATNIAAILEANTRLEKASIVLENEALETVADNISDINTTAIQIKDITTVASFNPRLTIVEKQAATNTSTIAEHESRLSNIETTSDVGKFATKIEEINTKDQSQDASIQSLQKSLEETKTNIDQNVSTAITKESELRTTADSNLEKIINFEIADRTTADNSLSKSLTDEASKLATSISDLSKTVSDNKSATNSSIADVKSKMVDLSSNQTVTGYKTFTAGVSLNNNTLSAGQIELSNSTPYIDFHYNKSSSDFTSRIIEDAQGTLKVVGNLNTTGAAYAATPDQSDNSTRLATTNYVASKVATAQNTLQTNINTTYNLANTANNKANLNGAAQLRHLSSVSGVDTGSGTIYPATIATNFGEWTTGSGEYMSARDTPVIQTDAYGKIIQIGYYRLNQKFNCSTCNCGTD